MPRHSKLASQWLKDSGNAHSVTIGVIYDFIMVVTDRLTKYAYFIPYLKSFLTEDLAYRFYKYIVANYGFL
jgi:hypothetical protein